MPSENCCIFVGHVGRDPKIRYIQDGTAVANFSLAVNRYVKKEKQTTWVPIVAWGSLAEVCESYVRKGDPLYVRGSLQIRSWEDKEGNQKERAEIRADVIQLLKKKEDTNYTSKDVDFESCDDDDIPF